MGRAVARLAAASCWRWRSGSSVCAPGRATPRRVRSRRRAGGPGPGRGDLDHAQCQRRRCSARVDTMALLEAHADVDLIDRLALGRLDSCPRLREGVSAAVPRRRDPQPGPAPGRLCHGRRGRARGALPDPGQRAGGRATPWSAPRCSVRRAAGGAGLAPARGRRRTGDHRRDRRGRPSLLVSQRSEFAAVIERQDLDGLLAELRARAASARRDRALSARYI